MKEIKLTQGKVALVDDEDFEKVNQFKWFVTKSSKARIYYAGRRSHKSDNTYSQGIKMHQAILGIKLGFIIDHINRNGLDNRRENLRHVTHSENRRNMDTRRIGKTSELRGVGWAAHRNKWRAFINVNGKFKHLGYFRTELLAAIVFEYALKQYYPNEIGLYG